MAYADFITAMMALFLVLWLTSQDSRIKEAVERSFRNPFGSVTKESTGIIPTKDAVAVTASSGNFDSAAAVELRMLRRVADEFLKALQGNPDSPEESPVKVETVPDGVRISIFDRGGKSVFHVDSSRFTDYGNWVFSTLAWELARFSREFDVELEGHTERGRPAPGPDFDDWDLTAERANQARHRLVEHGVRDSQIQKVAGYADRVPLSDMSPTNESNRRVSVLLKVRSTSHL